MLKDMAWNIFKKTGDINTFLQFKDLEEQNSNINVNDIENKGGLFGNNQNKGNSN